VIQSETVEDDRADQGAGRDVPVRGIGGDHGPARDFRAAQVSTYHNFVLTRKVM
jgi:hypothetical protein